MLFPLPKSIVGAFFIACLLPGHAQDSPGTIPSSLNSLSANEDILNYADDVTRKILGEHADDSGLNANWVDPYVAPLGGFDCKTLVATFSQLPLPTSPSEQDFRKIMLEHFLLKSAIWKFATAEDIPALLAANTSETLEIIRNRHWQDDPRVSAFLINALEEYQASAPKTLNSRGDPTFVVLSLANLSGDPKVKITLADTTAKATSDPDSSPAYLKMLTDGARHSSSSPTNQKLDIPAQTNESLTDNDRSTGIIVGSAVIPKSDNLEVIIAGLAHPGINEIRQHRKQNYHNSEYIVALASLGYYESSFTVDDIRHQLADLESHGKALWVHYPEDGSGRCSGKWDAPGDQPDPDGALPAGGYYDMYSAIHHAVLNNKTSILLISLFSGGDKPEATKAIIDEMRTARTRLSIIAADPAHPPYPALTGYAQESGGTAIIVNQGYDPYVTPSDSNKEIRQYALAPVTESKPTDNN